MLLYDGYDGLKRDLKIYSHRRLKEFYFDCIDTINDFVYSDYAMPEIFSELWQVKVLDTLYHDKICQFTVEFDSPLISYHTPLRFKTLQSHYNYTPSIRIRCKILLGKVRTQDFKGYNMLSNYIL